MILQALYDYYYRKSAQDAGSIAPLGFQHQEIPFVIVLEPDGRFVQLQDMREGEGKKKRARVFLVPQAVKRTSGVAANLLWDKPDYVLGYAMDATKPEKAKQAHAAFVARLKTFADGHPALTSVQAIMRFLANHPLEAIQQDPVWAAVMEATNSFLTFRLRREEQIVCERPDVFAALEQQMQTLSGLQENESICLITGQKDKIEATHPAIKGVLGSQTAGANIISFNLGAFCSYGKQQGYNAPVGKQAATAYTTALNLLLSKDSWQKIQLAGTTVVFWAEKSTEEAERLEGIFAAFFVESQDNPDRGRLAISALYNSPHTGKLPVAGESNRFFVLGLSPNAARLAIRFWHVLPLEELEPHIRQHFDDLAITHGPHESPFLPLRRLIRELCVQHKLENAPPNLEGDFFESILLGTPYPLGILQALIRRIRAEQSGEYSPISYPRVALLKAFLNRWYRRYGEIKKESTVSLDETNSGAGYCAGRLFAVLERIQEQANPGLNATIRDRYYGAVSSTPGIVFPLLLKLKNHHLNKLSPATRIYYERLLGEITAHFEGNMPQYLSLFEQGAFAVGYYHQRQALFTKRQDAENAVASDTDSDPALGQDESALTV